MAETRARDAQKEMERLAAKQRKEKMQQMDAERAAKLPLSDISLENKQRQEGLLSRAQMLLDEQLDDVKQMNQMVFYSKVVTVRDKQLEESKQLEEEYIAEQKKLDLMMEIERLKKIKEEEEREA